MNFKNVFMLLLFGSGLATAQAQETTAASGGDALGAGGSVSYTIGQVVSIPNEGTMGSVAPGVQNPYEIFSIGIEEGGIKLLLSIYPNPAKEYVILQIENWKKGDFFYQLYDFNGRLLENKETESKETRINMRNLAAASYFLKVIGNDKEVKTFKIIKK